MWPGPTFEVRKGQPLSIKWSNQLPTKHFLPIDYTIHGSEENVAEVRTVTHVHGVQVLPESDGYPDSWFTSDGKTGSVAGANPTHHPNEQSSRMLWYHDQLLGITRLNVYAGLAGFYVIRDDQEDALNLPNGPYEIPLMIQGRSFGVDGSLLYPPAKNGTHPLWMQEFFGDTICVNGKAASFLEVERRSRPLTGFVSATARPSAMRSPPRSTTRRMPPSSPKSKICSTPSGDDRRNKSPRACQLSRRIPYKRVSDDTRVPK